MRRIEVRAVTFVTVAALTVAALATPSQAVPAAVPEGPAGPLAAGVTRVDVTAVPAAIGRNLRAATARYASTVARTPDGRTIATASDAEAIRRYWTPERMRRALPARAPAPSIDTGGVAIDPDATSTRTDSRPPSEQALVEAARAVGAEITPAAAASRTVGKVFFIDPIDGREHFCSGATVNSTKGRLVATAGHCVHNGVWMVGWIFAPLYDNGLHPTYGQWIAGNLAARTDWMYYRRSSADVGVAIMDNNLSGRRIIDVVGGNGLAWNQGLGHRVDILGYPAASPHNGLTQKSCTATTSEGIDVGQIGAAPCNFTAGGSGSPMLLGYGELGTGLGYVNSVVADIYTPRPNEVFGPYFDDVNAGLFYYAEAISP